jgi:hypothetical protein
MRRLCSTHSSSDALLLHRFGNCLFMPLARVRTIFAHLGWVAHAVVEPYAPAAHNARAHVAHPQRVSAHNFDQSTTSRSLTAFVRQIPRPSLSPPTNPARNLGHNAHVCRARRHLELRAPSTLRERCIRRRRCPPVFEATSARAALQQRHVRHIV